MTPSELPIETNQRRLDMDYLILGIIPYQVTWMILEKLGVEMLYAHGIGFVAGLLIAFIIKRIWDPVL